MEREMNAQKAEYTKMLWCPNDSSKIAPGA